MNSTEIIGYATLDGEITCPDCTETQCDGSIPEDAPPILAGAETDSPMHCSICNTMLDGQSLTRDGQRFVAERIAEYIVGEGGDAVVLQEWAGHASISADVAAARAIVAAIGGTWSHGTLRTQDLLVAAADCADALAKLCPDAATDLKAAAKEARDVVEQLAAIDEQIDAAEDGEGPSPLDIDRAQWGAMETLEAITDEIGSALPAPLYYGCTEGDGSDIGIWCSVDD